MGPKEVLIKPLNSSVHPRVPRGIRFSQLLNQSFPRIRSSDIAGLPTRRGNHTQPARCRSGLASAGAVPDSTPRWNLARGDNVFGPDPVPGLPDPITAA